MAIQTVDRRARGLRTASAADAIGAFAILRRLDWVLVAAVAGIVLYGLRAIGDITRHDPGGSLAGRQALYAAVGAVGLVAATLIDPAFYHRIKNLLYGLMLGGMALVLVAGVATRGSRRWIDLGFFQFQPSEFGLVIFILFMAAFLADRARRMDALATPLTAIAVAAPPIVLILVQPDIGTAAVYVVALVGVLFVVGVRWLHLALLAAVAVLAATAVLWLLPAAGVTVLQQYQTQRITGFTHPGTDPQGVNYNIEQSIIAVGAGGLRGRGVIGATQTRLAYLPANDTDFVFSSFAEQRGFLGASILLLLYLLVVWRALRVVTGARDLFSATVAGAFVFAFLFQVFVNVGMAIGIAPITGIPLPFVSVGGSSMIANLVGIGILLAIQVRGGRRRAA
jgi:rod shape determining protein RodA